MADTSHLERMGRELKCPICLSLLNYAVSLTCNHAFCGSCIEKSMKSVSNCPVCKVPFRRREIRPAPHMDNLVSIYKSMEIASGVSIFVTQTAPSTKLTDHENQPDGIETCGMEENSKTCRGAAALEHQERCINKGGERSKKAKPRTTCQEAGKSSFPTKKRIHVPQFPPSETPTQPAKSNNVTCDTGKSVPESSRDQKDKLIFNANEEPAFTPFFWLRDDIDAEEVTQHTDGDLIMETPPSVPCFSDIKDSDDEIPHRSTPNMETCTASSEAHLFESEMFEWTQRACSPELYSSPVRMQVLQIGDTNHHEVQERNGYASEYAATLFESSVENRDIMMNEEEPDKVDLGPLSSSGHKIVNGGSEKSCKRSRKAVQKSKNKRAKKIVNEASGTPKASEHITRQHMLKKLNGGNSSNMIKRNSKRKQNVGYDANVTETTPANPSADMSSLSNVKKYKRSNTKRSVRTSEGISLQKGPSPKLKSTKMKAAKDSMIQNHDEVLISYLPNRSSPDQKKTINKEMVIRKCEVKSAKRKEDLKRVKFLEENKSENSLADISQSQGITGKVTAEDTPKLGVVQGNSSGGYLNKSSNVEDASYFSKSILNRSSKRPKEILCAFCRSAEESEATGIMVHYLEGKPVAGDQIGGPNVIHSHKSCAEWAPNVFFQDNEAINLETELTRSRRIKCSFCGINGAALGCYEKSCRKSFHVPCAKLTPECRWDHDNFVMLCPMHANCILPSEVISQSNWKRKSVPERPSDFHQQLLVRDERKAHLQWKSHIQSKNLVLCCSGLTEIEKGTISEFEKLSGVKFLKNWDSSVTHVIASVNENGACKRTLKFLMGVLEGKWILTTQWIQACIKSAGLVDENDYEIGVDVHGVRDGPRLGRLRLLNKKPKLFNMCKFYFMGDFAPSYKKYLHDLVIAGGGTILNRKPISEDPKRSSGCLAPTTFIIYNLELPEKCEPTKTTSILQCRCLDAKSLASSTGAIAVSNSWILNSISGCKLQNLTE